MGDKGTEAPTETEILADILLALQEQAQINARVANALEELLEIARQDRPARFWPTSRG